MPIFSLFYKFPFTLNIFYLFTRNLYNMIYMPIFNELNDVVIYQWTETQVPFENKKKI